MSAANIIFFTGPNTVFLKRDLSGWKDVFVQKHGEINLLVTHADTRNPNQTISECLTPGFMGGSRLIVLNGLPSSASTTDKEEKERNLNFEEKFLEIYESIPETNFLIFAQPHPDKRTRFYKQLLEIATIKEYSEPTLVELEKYMQERLTIDTAAAHRLIQKKNNDITSIESEIQRFALYKPGQHISITDIDENVTDKLENRIFDLLDVLMDRRLKHTMKEFQILSSNENVFLIFSSLLSNLRKIIYALLLIKK